LKDGLSTKESGPRKGEGEGRRRRREKKELVFALYTK
jgi:hypothetical protein